MRQNPNVMVFAFLVACSPTLALAGRVPEVLEPQQEVQQQQQLVPPVGSPSVDQAWLTKQSKDLLEIIKALYKGRDGDLKELETNQAIMTPQEQIERRIALIKATLSQKEAK